ncbi:MAG: DUF1998 domain-containing protein, partial [Myxococcales bacterium]|nr:DUF1998 domain-containing protein [Myxococcales bacterium]
RAGRRLTPSLAVLVACSEPLDQFVAGDPSYLLGRRPEHARVEPDNPSILVPHLKCAAYELPFDENERYGELAEDETREVLDALADARLLHRGERGYHHVSDAYPAAQVSLRGPVDENFLVVEEPRASGVGAAGAAPAPRIIAEVDYDDAPQDLHDHAIYQLEGRQYQVLRLDHDNHKAYVEAVEVDYYTTALLQTRVRVLERASGTGCASHGEVHVLDRVVGFKKIKLHTHENIGYGDVSEPDREMHTTALWLTLEPRDVLALGWTAAEVTGATMALSRALHSAAALLLMSERRDLGRAMGDARSSWFPVAGRGAKGLGGGDAPPDPRAPFSPTVFLFDRYRGGIGLAERLFDERHDLLARTRAMLERCECDEGCPGCVGPGQGVLIKRRAAKLAERFEQALGRELLAQRALEAQPLFGDARVQPHASSADAPREAP